MMPNLFSDTLFQLIQSLEKSEKRHFKLYIKRSSAKEDLKIIRLFDALDKLSEYDEKILLKSLSDITKPQLSNLKTHLYKQLLASLRLLKTNENIDLKLSEHLDNARLLYSTLQDLIDGARSLNPLPQARGRNGDVFPRMLAVAEGFLAAAENRFDERSLAAYVGRILVH